MHEILIMAIAIDQHHGFKPFNRTQRCSLQSFTQFDYNVLELSQTNLSNSLKPAFEGDNIHRSFSTPCFPLANSVKEEVKTNPKIEIVGAQGVPKVRAFVVEVAIAMASGVDLLPLSSGLGGAYLLRSKSGDDVAIAKPVDEEPLAFNNPKGFGGLMLGQPGIKSSICVGETGIRELAAYLLDHEKFAGVPATTLVKIAHVGFHVNDAASISPLSSKVASIQRFVDHDFDAGELGPSGFSVASVHRIGIFDIRVLNLDRHAGNILVKKIDHKNGNYTVGAAELVPIDHGLCLPEWFDDPYFEWLHWPQASVPFSEPEIEYISNLDPFKDAELLRKELPSLKESSIRVLIICTIFLKQAAAAGLSLADIGEMMTREFDVGEENLSVLENLCVKAKGSVVSFSIENNEDKSNDQTEEETIVSEIFDFDYGSEDISSDVMNLPHLLQCSPNKFGKPPKVPRFTSAKSMPRLDDAILTSLYEHNDLKIDFCNDSYDKSSNQESCCQDDNKDNNRQDNKALGITRSKSYSIQSYNCETTEVSVGDMSIDEWDMFLECFQQLLQEVLDEGAKCIGLKQRLGNSCKF